jgi:hypothetical protein
MECHENAVAKAVDGRKAEIDKCEERAVSEMRKSMRWVMGNGPQRAN